MGFKAALKVRFSDVDNAGIVYYPRFFHYFHVAFEEFFAEALQTPYPVVLGVDKVGLPVVHIETDFQKAITFGDRIEVEIKLERLGRRSGTFLYHLRKEGDPEIRAVAHITIACIDLDTFQAMEWPEKYRTMLTDYQATQDAT